MAINLQAHFIALPQNLLKPTDMMNHVSADIF